MTARLTWFELSALKPGAVVAFGEDHSTMIKGGDRIIPAGTVCAITEQGLNDIWGGLVLRPVDDALAASLIYYQDGYDGEIIVNQSAPYDGDDQDWSVASPFTLAEIPTTPECI